MGRGFILNPIVGVSGYTIISLALKKHIFVIHSLYPWFNVFVCVVGLRTCQPSGVMSSTVSLPNHTFAGQA